MTDKSESVAWQFVCQLVLPTMEKQNCGMGTNDLNDMSVAKSEKKKKSQNDESFGDTRKEAIQLNLHRKKIWKTLRAKNANSAN